MGRAARFTEMAELWEFGSLTGFPGAPCPAASCTLQIKNGCFAGVWEFGKKTRAGRPVPGTYPQVTNKLYMIREFGSLKGLDTNLGPRAFLHITRAQDLWSFGQDP